MAKCTDRELSESDIKGFIANQSDFSFELQTLNQLTKLGFECLHSGTYIDPVTSKSRQFDIRASMNYDRFRVRLAVECKNIRKSAPLIAHSIPRNQSEAYHSEISNPNIVSSYINISKCEGASSIYGTGANFHVCKSLIQVREEENNPNAIIRGKDDEIYDKWSQAVSSCYDLVRIESRAHAYESRIRGRAVSIVVPVLVVPMNTLWVTKFSDNGAWSGEVSPATHVSVFIGKEIIPWQGIDDEQHRFQSYWCSHLEVVSFDGVADFRNKLLDTIGEKRGTMKIS